MDYYFTFQIKLGAHTMRAGGGGRPTQEETTICKGEGQKRCIGRDDEQHVLEWYEILYSKAWCTY